MRDRRPSDTEAQALTPDERLAILGAALDLRHITTRGSDCSHFVHALYEHAGFPYAYASSTDLYVGIDEFRRVTTPQAGDLVVWVGHAGIVTNPKRHSFFSVLSSGPGVDSYESRYWKRRGHPRFFRYVKADNRGVRSSSLNRPDDF
ncbi:MAG TPA: NlpC/P60 family protein [Candidatus Acidoferrum sp.]|nr:NlpC/P60 family protein [Candidatus Acidoferrum sp.]